MDVTGMGVTIKQVADECGVSKSTAVRKFKELGLQAASRDGKGTVYLSPESASLLAHALGRGRSAEQPDPVDQIMAEITQQAPQGPDMADLVNAYRDQVRTLRESNEMLRSQVTHLNDTITSMRADHESMVQILSAQIDRLTEQVAAVQREKDHMRDELALSRALEGFHFPWQRDAIKSRFLLPSGSEDSPTYEL